MRRYRCVFWGLFLCFFHLNLWGVEIIPVSLALAIFTFGLYGIADQAGNRQVQLAAKLALAGTILRAVGSAALMIAGEFYRQLPSFTQYILFSLTNLFLMLAVWNLLAGMRAIFKPLGEHPETAEWAVSCGRGMAAAPILFALPVLLYGLLMNLPFSGYGDAENAMIAVACGNLIPGIYSMYLLTRYKRYLSLAGKGESETPTNQEEINQSDQQTTV